MKEEITDEEADILQDYYFEHYATHNEDEAGCECWMADLDREEVDYLIAKIKKNN
jgi:hypothetical protein